MKFWFLNKFQLLMILYFRAPVTTVAWWLIGRVNSGQKLLKARRGSGHNMSFKRSFKLKRPEDGGGS